MHNFFDKVPDPQWTVRPIKVLTTYKWYLEDWTVLNGLYRNGVTSPEFLLTDTENITCNLKFNASSDIHDSLMIITFSQTIDFLIQANVSIVNENLKKLLTVTKTLFTHPRTIKVCFKDDPNRYSEKRTYELFPNDTLTLFIELVMVKGLTNSFPDTVIRNPTFDINVCEKINELRDSVDCCDVTFNILGMKLYAHRVILASASDVFRAMFTNEMREKEEGVIYIKDTSLPIFKAFLEYLYTGQVNRINKVAKGLIIVADKYDVSDLKELCQRYLSFIKDAEKRPNISTGNV